MRFLIRVGGEDKPALECCTKYFELVRRLLDEYAAGSWTVTQRKRQGYLLWHARNLDEDIDVKLIGVYSSEQKANEARERVRDKPGFRDYPNGFHIDGYEVDKDSWTEGFDTVRW